LLPNALAGVGLEVGVLLVVAASATTGLGDGVAAVTLGVLLGLGLGVAAGVATITPVAGLLARIAGLGAVALGEGCAAALSKGDNAKRETSPAIFIVLMTYITSCQL
jgi:hypothetical protein